MESLHDSVELVAMQHKKSTAIERLVNCVPGHDHAAEMHTAKVTHAIIVIARNISDGNALPRQAKNLCTTSLWDCGQYPTAFHTPSIHNVADEIKPFAAHVTEEIQQ